MADAQLRQMAKTAFDVLNWARRNGLNQERQLDEVVNGFRVDLKEFREGEEADG